MMACHRITFSWLADIVAVAPTVSVMAMKLLSRWMAEMLARLPASFTLRVLR